MNDFHFPYRPQLSSLLDQPSEVFVQERCEGEVWLNANENPFNAPFNRYASGHSRFLAALGRIRKVPTQNIFLCRGTYEAMDLLLNLCCSPCRDNVITTAPTFTYAQKLCRLHDVECRIVQLDASFGLSVEQALLTCNSHTRIIFLCSPNNPTGNLLDRGDVLRLAEKFQGIVVVDETYVDFAAQPSLLVEQSHYPNLVIIRSFAAFLASAGIGLAVIYAHPDLVRMLNAICPPHRISVPVLNEGHEMLRRHFDADRWKAQILDERTKVMAAFKQLDCCIRLYPSDANFFLVKIKNSQAVFRLLESRGIHVFNCHSIPRCQDCFRITVGLNSDNSRLLGVLRSIPRKARS